MRYCPPASRGPGQAIVSTRAAGAVPESCTPKLLRRQADLQDSRRNLPSSPPATVPKPFGMVHVFARRAATRCSSGLASAWRWSAADRCRSARPFSAAVARVLGRTAAGAVPRLGLCLAPTRFDFVEMFPPGGLQALLLGDPALTLQQLGAGRALLIHLLPAVGPAIPRLVSGRLPGVQLRRQILQRLPHLANSSSDCRRASSRSAAMAACRRPTAPPHPSTVAAFGQLLVQLPPEPFSARPRWPPHAGGNILPPAPPTRRGGFGRARRRGRPAPASGPFPHSADSASGDGPCGRPGPAPPAAEPAPAVAEWPPDLVLQTRPPAG